jgi:hypothetical protein
MSKVEGFGVAAGSKIEGGPIARGGWWSDVLPSALSFLRNDVFLRMFEKVETARARVGRAGQ